jgi:hypothetical protein
MLRRGGANAAAGMAAVACARKVDLTVNLSSGAGVALGLSTTCGSGSGWW